MIKAVTRFVVKLAQYVILGTIWLAGLTASLMPIHAFKDIMDEDPSQRTSSENIAIVLIVVVFVALGGLLYLLHRWLEKRWMR